MRRLVIILAVLYTAFADVSLKGAAPKLRAQDLVHYQSVVGNFPSSPVYTVYQIFSDHNCLQQTGTGAIVLDTCMTPNPSGGLAATVGSQKFSCDNGVAHLTKYVNTHCSSSILTPPTQVTLNTTCAVNKLNLGGFGTGTYYKALCTSVTGNLPLTNPFPAGQWNTQLNYFQSCLNNQIVDTTSYLNNVCYDVASHAHNGLSMIINWPNAKSFNGGPGCQGTGSPTNLPQADCVLTVDDDGQNYGTYVSWQSSVTPSTGGGTYNSTSNSAASSSPAIVMQCLLMISFIMYFL